VSAADCGREVEADFLHEAALAQFVSQGFSAAEAGGADDVHADLAGGVAAENGAVLAKDDAGSKAGGSERTADAAHAAASDEEVGVEGGGFQAGSLKFLVF
jgi:hypothetical protein